ncbi:aldolase [Georgenia sp. EYE_87]|uniref:HpcH/HpaI aldolase family protein n=1 Tax=Georgenia sp. EYE_87 TaxID=2853448 RepID=UPI002005A3F1|nr:aldolase/citrate lyase family protein [Georgenia sp. EYE_87]MCK6211658.1 aldolase [Georgenia sp. EYE_87]
MSLKQAWADGRVTFGVWSALDDPVAAEIVGRAGFDLVCVDLQHGFADPGSATAILAALHRTPAASVVRVAWNAPEQIMRALDLGAEGVIVPMVDDAEQARRAVAACRYAPAGRRSWGPLWGDARRGAPEPDEGDRLATCILMIETADGLANVEEIVRVPGVDAVYVGPNDLALSLGLGRRPEAPELEEAVLRVVDAARGAGVAVGIDRADPAGARRWAERGMDLVIAARDSVLLREAADRAARELRRTDVPSDGHPSGA